MLKSIRIENGFKHHNVTYRFDQGLTTITGPNESGKSLILEFIRYALFGTAALRGKAEDYKNLAVDLEFHLHGKDYRVVRKKSRAELMVAGDTGWDIIASGHSVLNEKIPTLFGYGLSVFDMAHAVNQGSIEALGSMKPTERKRMVDSVIGLTQLDDLIKETGETALLHKRSAEAVEAVLRKPIEPTVPANYRPVKELSAELVQKQALKQEFDEIRGWLQRAIPMPTAPEPCAVTETVEELERIVGTRQGLMDTYSDLKGQRAQYQRPQHTSTFLDEQERLRSAYDAWILYKTKMAGMPAKPDYDLREANLRLEELAAYREWRHHQDLIDKNQVECPKCGEKFAPGVKEQMCKKMPEPGFTEAEVRDQLARIRAWDAAPEPVPEVTTEPMSKADITHWRAALAHVDVIEVLDRRIATLEAELTTLPDRREDLKARMAYEVAMNGYEKTMEAWKAYEQERQVKEARLNQLVDLPAELAQLTEQYNEARIYETQLDLYLKALAEYQQDMEKVQTDLDMAEQYRRAKSALNTLKSKVKSHLVPSLNVCASQLLRQMTNGVRQTIQVDEDFNILVDGQEIATLSGSGKAVANLAIRIGLGQVLTNRVFSVFMGDELDAAMDNDRAEYTAECLRNLKGRVKQIILVTHKRPEADHYIELGDQDV